MKINFLQNYLQMKKILISLLLIIFAVASYAQPWNVNTAKYEYSMTITAKIKINGLYIAQTNCWLGVFSGNECRGYVQAEQQSNGAYFFFLTIFSNSTDGEKLTFKFNNGFMTLPTLPQTALFLPDEVVGTPDLPFLITYPLEFSYTDFLSFSVVNQIGTTIIDKIKKTIAIKVDGNTQLNNLKTIFVAPVGTNVFVNNQLQESNITSNNFTQPVTYTLKGIDGIDTNWLVSVSKLTSTNSLPIKSLSVFPNPTSDLITLSFPNDIGDGILKIADLSGKIVKEMNFTGSNIDVNISEFPKGMYLLSATSKSCIYRSKILKE